MLVPTPYTTRVCHACGHLHGKISVGVREFECEECGVKLVRDQNSAVNIEHRGKIIWKEGVEAAEEKFKEKHGDKYGWYK